MYLSVKLLLIFSILTSFSTRSGELLLIGDQLKICTNVQTQHCITDQFLATAKRAPVYQFDPVSIKNFMESAAITALAPHIKEQLAKILYKAAERFKDKDTRDNETLLFFKQLENYLPSSVVVVIQSFLERTDMGKEEVVTALNNNIYSQLFLDKFINATKRISSSTPIIGIVTAGSNTPYNTAQKYQTLFEQLGVKSIWIPISRAVNMALKREDCESLDHYRQQVGLYNQEALHNELTQVENAFCQAPQHLLSSIEKVQGIFFTHGNPSVITDLLTQSDSPLSNLGNTIKFRFKQKKLIIAAEGRSVLAMSGGGKYPVPVPMITRENTKEGFSSNSTSQPKQFSIGANKLSYYLGGGLGLFDIGPIDINYSENDRLAALAMVAAKTEQSYAFGIDKDTALFVSNNEYTVFGKAGVTILDLTHSKLKTKPHSLQLIASKNYLLNSDQFTWQESVKQIQTLVNNSNQPAQLDTKDLGFLRYRHNKSCGDSTPASFNYEGIKYAWFPDNHTRYFISNLANHCGYTNLTFGIEY